jgi:ABC-type transport system involved in cytochrome bd biosynthesis fused ATPase/permease subunit
VKKLLVLLLALAAIWIGGRFVLHRGEVREIGTHAELLARRGIYAKLYQLQFAGHPAKEITPSEAVEQ